MPITPWKILSSSHPLPNIRLDQCELRDGRHIQGFVLEFHDWVTVLALTKQNEVVMIRQYRHGAQQVIEELPGGMIDPEDRDPLEGARRELLEETGYTSERFVLVGKVSPNPAIQNNTIYSYLALDAEQAGAQSLDETEEIEVLLKPLDEVVRMAQNSQLLQAMQVATVFFTLAWLERNR